MAYLFRATKDTGLPTASRTALTAAEMNDTLAAAPTATAGTAQLQATSKATTVVLSALVGTITMDGAQLNAATIVSFTLTNTLIVATDIILIEHVSGGTSGAYLVNAFPGAGSAVISVRNNTAGNLTESPVLRFKVIHTV